MKTLQQHAQSLGFKPAPGTMGLLARCVHRGSFPESSKAGGTTIGTDDPARWQYLLWFEGEFWAAELLTDMRMDRPGTFEELKGHFDRCRESEESPWRRVEVAKLTDA